MKKTICLSLGFSLIAAGLMISFTEASRDAYHVLTPYERSYPYEDHFSEGQNQRQTAQMQQTEKRNAIAAYKQARRYRGSRENFQSSVQVTQSNRNLSLRPSTDRIAPNTNKTIRTSYQPAMRVTPMVVQQVQSSLYTFENDEFSVMLPNEWALTSNEGDVHTYTNAVSNYVIRVKSFDQGTCGQSTGFTTCAVQLSKSENYRAVNGAGRVDVTSKILRASRTENTVLNRLDIETATYREQFSGVFPFMGEKNVARLFVQDLNGGAFMVEAMAPYNEAARYTETTKRIFDSFRMYEVTQ